MTTLDPGRTRSMGLKLLLIGALIALLGIPLLIINVLAWERAGRAETVAAEIGQAHGGPQTIRGPFLVIPVETRIQVTNQSGTGTTHEMRRVVQPIIVSPETLTIQTRIETEILHRAIYDTPVYQAHLALSGRFETAGVETLIPEGGVAQWENASLVYGLSDLRGIAEDVRLAISGRASPLQFEPRSDFDLNLGPGGQSWRGMSAPLSGLEAGAGFDFDADLRLSGAQRLSIQASGRETLARVTSDWAHPGFSGAYLPDVREISDSGFSAEWRVPYLARGVPALWLERSGYTMQNAETAVFTINLVSPSDGYVRVSRSLKYAMAFLGLTLLLFFLIEASGGRRLHAAQYVLIGMTQITFYLLLLAFSEHVPVWTAYAIAAIATITVTSLYARAAFNDRPRAALTLCGLTVAFGVQYVLILVEDYALLIGSVLVFATLAGTMYLTRKVDWYGRAAAGSSD